MRTSNMTMKCFGFALFLLLFCNFIERGKCKVSIAIVGGGIGGASCSHFLWELLGNDIEIDLYEENEIGGRLATVTVNGKEYESGGSIIHPANRYMKNFSKILGLKESESNGGRLGIFNGKEMVFDGSRFSLLMVMQLFYHYGWDIYRINKYVRNLLLKFERIYEHQKDGHAFTSVENLLRSMDPSFVDMIHKSVVKDMTEWGLGEKFIGELVHGGLRTNYGQGLHMQSFVGGVSMAGIEPGLWSVHGGNKRIPLDLVNNSSTTVFRAKVTEVTLTAQEKVKYRVASMDTAGVLRASEYDFVVIATPLFNNIGDIQFKGFPEPIVKTQYNFHRTLATFVEGQPNVKNFHLDDAESFPEELFTCNDKLFYNSIGKHLPVDWSKENQDSEEKYSIYKVFSNTALTNTQLDELFEKQSQVKVVDWLAYPEYPLDVEDLPSFQMHKHIFYINAIEMAASAMEMSAIGAKNVALLVNNEIKSQEEYVDSPSLTGHKMQTKQEL